MGEDLLYCNPFKSWFVWDGTRWKEDNTQAATRWAQLTVRTIYQEAAEFSKEAAQSDQEAERGAYAKQAELLLRHAKKSEGAERVKAILTMAQPLRPVLPDQLDQDPWVLNVQNGTIDLRTGTLRPHRQTDRLTKTIPLVYDPDARCPLWETFLAQIFNGSPDLIDFVFRAIGYSLTGNTREDCLFLLHGNGSNGKSTFLGILYALFAEYAVQADFTSFLQKDREAIRNDIAMMKGARFVSAIEADAGKRLAEVLVKQLTGGDPVTARFLHREYFTYLPQFSLWLAANHKPVIRGTDHGIWRRIRLLPFTVTIPDEEQDQDLQEKLTAELPGILAWAIRGCLAWQRDRLTPPDVVTAATAEYRAEQDVFGGFIRDCCVVKPEAYARTKTLHEAYLEWSGDTFMTLTAFGTQLTERGFQKRKNPAGNIVCYGIGLGASSAE